MGLRGRWKAEAAMRDRPRLPLHDGLVPLARALKEGSVEEKLQAIISVSTGMETARITPEDAARLLGETLEDGNSGVRRSAVLALAQHGSRLLTGLRMGLMNNDPHVRAISAAMICMVFSRDSTLFRNNALPPDGSVRGMVRDLCHALLDDQSKVRIYGLVALCEVARRNPLAVLEGLEAFTRQALGEGIIDQGLGSRLETARKIATQSVDRQARFNMA
jgi:HEAT repeat protein